mgnify:CR=1 FL=1
MKSPLRFSDAEVIGIPATCLENDPRPLGTIQAIFVWKERFDAISVPTNDYYVNDRIKLTNTGFETFRDLVALQT